MIFLILFNRLVVISACVWHRLGADDVRVKDKGMWRLEVKLAQDINMLNTKNVTPTLASIADV
jgi:hypothetical protein